MIVLRPAVDRVDRPWVQPDRPVWERHLRDPILQNLSLAPRPVLIKMQLLGDFGVFQAGVPVRIRQCGQRLLALLGLHQRPLPRSNIAGTLWPASAAAQASANLRAALTRLPRPGGHPLATAQDAQLRLSGHVQVDIWDCAARIRQAKVSGRSEPFPENEQPALLDDSTLPLLSHDVLPLWPEDWVVVERERHRQARLHSLERLSQKLCRVGWYEEALEAALAAVAGEPLRESAHRRVIEAHLAEGNPGEALRQYDIYRRLLREELGLGPSDSLRQLLRPLLLRPEDTCSTD
jgi:DNA-binding SARP family transcriptional activator